LVNVWLPKSEEVKVYQKRVSVYHQASFEELNFDFGNNKNNANVSSATLPTRNSIHSWIVRGVAKKENAAACAAEISSVNSRLCKRASYVGFIRVTLPWMRHCVAWPELTAAFLTCWYSVLLGAAVR